MSAIAPPRRRVTTPPTVQRRGGRRGTYVVLFAVVVGATIMVGVVAGPSLRPSTAADGAARRAAAHFLDRYVEPDGRVVRRDQGGDTVSEGQAYAMLVAQATGDRNRFRLAWDWARAHLQRPDGLLAWRWADGRVEDDMPAADADLDAAWALVLAAGRFDDDGLRREGMGMAAAVLDNETAATPDGMVLVAGPWARQPPVVNPSYVSPGAFSVMSEQTGDHRWQTLARTSLARLDELMTGGQPLPPDWSRLSASGQLEAAPAPGHDGQGARYGLDAARLLTRLAPCAGPWRRLAASAWPVLAGAADGGTAVASDLRGRAMGPSQHAAKAVAAASSAHAAGDRRAADALMARAEELDRQSPTYYGAAWVALGRLLLTSSLGEDCGTERTGT